MKRYTSPLRRRASKKTTNSFMNYYTSNYQRLKDVCVQNTGSVLNTTISRYAADEWKSLTDVQRKQYDMNHMCFFEAEQETKSASRAPTKPSSKTATTSEVTSPELTTPEVKTEVKTTDVTTPGVEEDTKALIDKEEEPQPHEENGQPQGAETSISPQSAKPQQSAEPQEGDANPQLQGLKSEKDARKPTKGGVKSATESDKPVTETPTFL